MKLLILVALIGCTVAYSPPKGALSVKKGIIKETAVKHESKQIAESHISEEKEIVIEHAKQIHKRDAPYAPIMPHDEYGVPEEVKIIETPPPPPPPLPILPEIVVQEDFPAPIESYPPAIPHDEYGPPAIPHDEYGPPPPAPLLPVLPELPKIIVAEKPIVPVLEYIPSAPHDDYGPPPAPHDEYGPPPAPHDEYGPPPVVHDLYIPPPPPAPVIVQEDEHCPEEEIPTVFIRSPQPIAPPLPYLPKIVLAHKPYVPPVQSHQYALPTASHISVPSLQYRTPLAPYISVPSLKYGPPPAPQISVPALEYGPPPAPHSVYGTPSSRRFTFHH